MVAVNPSTDVALHILRIYGTFVTADPMIITEPNILDKTNANPYSSLNSVIIIQMIREANIPITISMHFLLVHDYGPSGELFNFIYPSDSSALLLGLILFLILPSFIKSY